MSTTLLGVVAGPTVRRCGCGSSVVHIVTRWALRTRGCGERSSGWTFEALHHTSPDGSPCPSGEVNQQGGDTQCTLTWP